MALSSVVWWSLKVSIVDRSMLIASTRVLPITLTYKTLYF